MLITWDEPKRLANLAKHGLYFRLLNEAFFISAVVVPARGRRQLAIDRLSNDVVSVILANLGTEAIAVISMRIADKNERKAIE